MEPNPYESPQPNEQRPKPNKPPYRPVPHRLREMQERNSQRNLYSGIILFSILGWIIYYFVSSYWR
ncbi:MAG: hypothetical protein K8R36_17075 [Planctomycetales bacterium]|nr:hypothetical protein [Planctomycetales bacterium]